MTWTAAPAVSASLRAVPGGGAPTRRARHGCPPARAARARPARAGVGHEAAVPGSISAAHFALPGGTVRPAPGRPRAVRGASPVVTAGRSGADGRLRPRPALMARGRPGTVPRTRDAYPHHPRGPPRGRRGRPVRRDRPRSGPVSCPTTAPGPRGGTREPEGSTSAARSAGPASRSGRRPSARDPATRPGSPAGVVLTRRCPRPGGAGVRG